MTVYINSAAIIQKQLFHLNLKHRSGSHYHSDPIPNTHIYMYHLLVLAAFFLPLRADADDDRIKADVAFSCLSSNKAAPNSPRISRNLSFLVSVPVSISCVSCNKLSRNVEHRGKYRLPSATALRHSSLTFISNHCESHNVN